MDVFRYAPVVIRMLAATKELHELLVMRDDDELEVALLASRGNNAARRDIDRKNIVRGRTVDGKARSRERT